MKKLIIFLFPLYALLLLSAPAFAQLEITVEKGRAYNGGQGYIFKAVIPPEAMGPFVAAFPSGEEQCEALAAFAGGLPKGAKIIKTAGVRTQAPEYGAQSKDQRSLVCIVVFDMKSDLVRAWNVVKESPVLEIGKALISRAPGL